MSVISRGNPSPSEPASEGVPKEALYAILIIFLLIALSLVMYLTARVAQYWGINRDVAKAHITSIVKAAYRTLGTSSAPGLAGAPYPLQTFPQNVPHDASTASDTAPSSSTGGSRTAVADTAGGDTSTSR
ncbi:hypothetical protein BDZ89DRAFT_638015 [Hymenopellis radicata]|nr:hypothetical protein BDZ89DRAFT_638015 [Hymenopellis radicata]